MLLVGSLGLCTVIWCSYTRTPLVHVDFPKCWKIQGIWGQTSVPLITVYRRGGNHYSDVAGPIVIVTNVLVKSL